MSKQITSSIVGRPARAVARSDGLIEFRDFTNGLLCLLDPARRLIHIQRRGEKSRIDLNQVLDSKTEGVIE